ncbi:hypothetical protein MKZ38_002334 [Zalerion maritima]|uniref:Uncharacterized protein n=1 Tax=Zalerion maritima TaxID=339359 RepID=A0AAD5RX83_9PEZI|nr:hypothetical protein MKZ38_002334 [Zalerion maritima]
MQFHVPSLLLISISNLIPPSLANTEKVIISAPPSSVSPSILPPPLRSLIVGIPILQHNDEDWSIRHHIPAAFPTTSHPDGIPSWYLLADLNPGQGYEIRICWAATQPTEFKLSTHTSQEVLDDASLRGSLVAFSDGCKSSLGLSTHELPEESSEADVTDSSKSALLLQILSAADYVSANATLMSDVPPVFVDVILDPHVIPGVPRSLVPTIACVVVVAIGSFFVAPTLSSWLARIAAVKPRGNDHVKKEQ